MTPRNSFPVGRFWVLLQGRLRNYKRLKAIVLWQFFRIWPLYIGKNAENCRETEVYSLTCWRCGREVELPAASRPYRCLHCGALLVIEWRSVPLTTPGARRARSTH
jgi:DNA-directed RNA polymerase subunit RPC12/RpoP